MDGVVDPTKRTEHPRLRVKESMTDPQMYVLLGSGFSCYVSGLAVNLFSLRRRLREPFMALMMVGFLTLFTAGITSMWQHRPKPPGKTSCTTLSQN